MKPTRSQFVAILSLVVLMTGTSLADWYKLWPSRQAITLQASQIAGTASLTNFAALVQLTDESNPLFTQAQADGDDLVFTLADGVTKLAHQIEMFETASGSRKLVAWVRIPELSATADTTIYLYYGKPDVVSQQNASGAWNNYVAVYHLNETNTTAGADNDVLDSAPAANHGEQVNGVTLGVPTGKVGRASLFTAASSTAVVMKNPANFNVTNLTMSLWFRTTGDKGTSWNGAFAGKGQLGNNLDYDLYVRNGKWRLYPRYFVGATTYDDDVISVPLGNGAWHHITVVADITTTTLVVYVDGAVDRTIATGLTPPLDFYTPRVFVIGRAWDNVRWFDGLIDEVRVERVARSADWIKSEYDTQNNPAAFVSFASAESGPPAASEAPWLPGGWLYRQKVLFDRTLVVGAATLTNFPMLVKLTYAGNPLWSRARSDGADIRFTEADGVTPLAHELELYNPATPELLAWVKVPAYSPSADTAAYLYYGKPGAANQQNAAGVWANYAAVYHLGETNTTAGADNDVLDSGPAANHGEQYNNVVLGVPTGRIGRAALFATNLQNYVTMKNPANFAVTNLTLSLWFRTAGDKGTTWKGGLAGKREAADTVNLDYDVYFDNSRWRFYPRFFVGYTYYEQQTPYTPNTANGAWHHIAAVADNTTTTLMVYVDGVINRTIVYGAAPGFTHYTSRSFTVGRSWDARYHDGLIDEVRVDPVARSADWIKSEYNLQVAPDGYTIFGAGEHRSGNATLLLLR